MNTSEIVKEAEDYERRMVEDVERRRHKIQLGHYIGVMPKEELPEYQDADTKEVYKRLSMKHFPQTED